MSKHNEKEAKASSLGCHTLDDSAIPNPRPSHSVHTDAVKVGVTAPGVKVHNDHPNVPGAVPVPMTATGHQLSPLASAFFKQLHPDYQPLQLGPPDPDSRPPQPLPTDNEVLWKALAYVDARKQARDGEQTVAAEPPDRTLKGISKRIGLSATTLRTSMDNAEPPIQRPKPGGHGHRYTPQEISRLARTRKTKGFRPGEGDKWRSLLADLHEPDLDDPLTARRRS